MNGEFEFRDRKESYYKAGLNLSFLYTRASIFYSDLSWYNRAKTSTNDDEKDYENNGFILIDVNNVRGRVGFTRASVKEFCAHLTYWAQEQSYEGNVILEVDHGPDEKPQSFCDENSGIVMSFAGTRIKADDLIVMDLNYLARRALKLKGESRHVVITSDRELKYRCKGVISTILRQERKKKLDYYFKGGKNSIEEFGHEPQLRFVDSDYFADYFATLDDLNEIKEEYDDSWCSDFKFGSSEEDQLVLTNAECTKQRKIQAKHLYNCLERVGVPKSNAQSRESRDNSESDPSSSWMDDYMGWVSSGRRCNLNFYL